jgi:hypothetical protein
MLRMKIQNQATMTVELPLKTTDELSEEDLKKLTDFFTLLIEIDQRNKRTKRKNEY